MSIALTRRLSRYPQRLRLSITYDNGPEMQSIGAPHHPRTSSYFCEPFHSYERGTVETPLVLSGVSCQEDQLGYNLTRALNKDRTCSITVRENVSDFKTPAEVFKAECCT